MKKISVMLAGLALIAASCNKNASSPSGESHPIRLVVRATGGGETRATGVTSNSEASEAKVNTLQVLVFNGDALDGYGSSTGSKTATVACTSGSRDIYALVNAPSMASVTSKSALLSSVANLSAEIDNFQMIGSTTETLQSDGSVSIHVGRLAARVVLKAIRNAHANTALSSQLRIESVYLTNAVGDVDYGMSPGYIPSVWYNRRGFETSNNLGAFTYDSVNETIAPNGTSTTAHYFYTMPNGFPGAAGLAEGETAFTPRAARLVVRAVIAGKLYNYPIQIAFGAFTDDGSRTTQVYDGMPGGFTYELASAGLDMTALNGGGYQFLVTVSGNGESITCVCSDFMRSGKNYPHPRGCPCDARLQQGAPPREGPRGRGRAQAPRVPPPRRRVLPDDRDPRDGGHVLDPRDPLREYDDRLVVRDGGLHERRVQQERERLLGRKVLALDQSELPFLRVERPPDPYRLRRDRLPREREHGHRSRLHRDAGFRGDERSCPRAYLRPLHGRDPQGPCGVHRIRDQALPPAEDIRHV